MTDLYIDNDDATMRFFNLYARIVIAWGRIERAVDFSLKVSKTFEPTGKAIVPWKQKQRSFAKVCRSIDEIAKDQKRIQTLLDNLSECAQIRHGLVHGYLQSIKGDPPKIHFRTSRFNAEETVSRDLYFTIPQLLEVFQRMHDLDAELSLFFMIIFQERHKATHST